MADTDKTEPATGHKRSEARDRGQVLKSIEVNTAVVLLGGFAALRVLVRPIYQNLSNLMRESFTEMATFSFTEGDITRLALKLLYQTGLMLLPLMGLIALAAIVASFLQVGFVRSFYVVRPHFYRINPFRGFTRFFSYRIFIDLIKSSVKVLIAGGIAYFILKGALKEIMLTIDMSPDQTVRMASAMVYQVGMRLGLAFVVLAACDYYYQKFEYEKSLKMTRQEVKEEFIRYEGRPEVKSRVKTVQRQIAMRRMMQEVPKADVVITNPTHLAIAIKYNPKEMPAPKVVAKGARLIAERIKTLAKEHNIPVVENKPLARMLFKAVDIGQVIPLNLYQAVADILAYLWRMGKLKTKLA